MIRSALNFGLPNQEEQFSDSSISSDDDDDRFWFKQEKLR